MKHIDEHDEEFWEVYRQQDAYVACELIALGMILFSLWGYYECMVKYRAVNCGFGILGAILCWIVSAVRYHIRFEKAVKAEEELFERIYGEDWDEQI